MLPSGPSDARFSEKAVVDREPAPVGGARGGPPALSGKLPADAYRQSGRIGFEPRQGPSGRVLFFLVPSCSRLWWWWWTRGGPSAGPVPHFPIPSGGGRVSPRTFGDRWAEAGPFRKLAPRRPIIQFKLIGMDDITLLIFFICILFGYPIGFKLADLLWG